MHSLAMVIGTTQSRTYLTMKPGEDDKWRTPLTVELLCKEPARILLENGQPCARSLSNRGLPADRRVSWPVK